MYEPGRLAECVAAAQRDRPDDGVRRRVDHREETLPCRREIASAVEALEAHEQPIGDERHLVHLREPVAIGVGTEVHLPEEETSARRCAGVDDPELRPVEARDVGLVRPDDGHVVGVRAGTRRALEHGGEAARRVEDLEVVAEEAVHHVDAIPEAPDHRVGVDRGAGMRDGVRSGHADGREEARLEVRRDDHGARRPRGQRRPARAGEPERGARGVVGGDVTPPGPQHDATPCASTERHADRRLGRAHVRR